MAAPIIVVGHKNPDNDAICAAVGYAWLKNEITRLAAEKGIEYPVYVPARLGPMPPETVGVFEKWGIETPQVVNNLHARVSDVMTPDPLCIAGDGRILDAGRILRKHNIQALVVTNEDGTYRGLISTRMIAERYIAATDVLEEGASQMAVASDLIASLDQTVDSIMEENILTLDAEDRLDEAAADLMNQPLREAVVLDEDNRPIGIVTRSDIAVHPHRQVILVDHNEIRQAANGIEDAEVVEIIDHHRIADVSTVNPIKFVNMPVGSSATIVALECERHRIPPTKPIAAVLLSAIMTDTVLLKSPTATYTDEHMVKYLADILEVDPMEFGMEVFSFRGGDDDMPIEDLVGADSKEFALGDGTVLIAQHETTNLKAVLEREDEMRTYMKELIANHGYEFVLLMVTDIIAEGSQFLVEGHRRTVDRAFDIDSSVPGGNWMPGILSRKKQVATRILGA